MALLDDKVALITGASTGIGAAIAERFVAEGATVYLTGRHQDTLDAAVSAIGPGAIAISSDISDLADLDRVYDRIRSDHGRVDVVVANAGGGEVVPVGEVTEKQFDERFAINVKGLFFTVQKALPLLPRGASVVLLGSTNACKGVPSMSIYGATKAAIRSLARSFAVELAAAGVRVNTLSPGPIETPGLMGLAADETEEAHAQLRDGFAAGIPLGRLGRPQEVAAAAAFLASAQSSFTTGAELFVDGGLAQM